MTALGATQELQILIVNFQDILLEFLGAVGDRLVLLKVLYFLMHDGLSTPVSSHVADANVVDYFFY